MVVNVMPYVDSKHINAVGQPMDSDGNRMYAQVQVTFVSRTAWDMKDIEAIYRG